MEQLTYPEHSDNAEIKVINELIKKLESAINTLELHAENLRNPHDVTKGQVGLGNVDNTSDANKPVSTAQATAIAEAKKAGTDAQTNLNNHNSNKSNPHGVTAAQVGAAPASHTHTPNSLGAAVTKTYTLSVPNTSWTLENGMYKNTISCDGLLATDSPIIDISLGGDLDANKSYLGAWGHIVRAVTSENSIVLYTDGAEPSVSFSMIIKVVR